MTKLCRFLSKTAETETNVSAHQIARAAARLFAAQGYDATPVRAICEAAGVTKPTLYYHFGNKEGLGKALLTDPLTAQLARLHTIFSTDEPPILQLQASFAQHFAFFREDPDRGRFLYAMWFGPLASKLSAELGEFAHQFDSVMLGATQRLADVGVIDHSRATACFMACKGLVVAYTLDHLYRGIELDAELPARLVHDVIDGFRTASPTGVSGDLNLCVPTSFSEGFDQ